MIFGAGTRKLQMTLKQPELLFLCDLKNPALKIQSFNFTKDQFYSAQCCRSMTRNRLNLTTKMIIDLVATIGLLQLTLKMETSKYQVQFSLPKSPVQ
jgi:hypothetical protein